jgi:hypothetical protein
LRVLICVSGEKRVPAKSRLNMGQSAPLSFFAVCAKARVAKAKALKMRICITSSICQNPGRRAIAKAGVRSDSGKMELGILVHGDNHFIVRGPCPDASTARALARYWSVIEIGSVTPEHLRPWQISTREFREDLQWAVDVPGEGETTPAVVQLLEELRERGIVVQRCEL